VLTKGSTLATTAEKKRIAELEEGLAILAEKEAEREKLKKENPRDRTVRETRENQVNELMDNLEKLGGKLHDDDDILYYGTKLVIPETMTIDSSIQFLSRKQDENERETVFSRSFNFRPWDGAWCMWQVMKRTFGAVNHRGRISFSMFGSMSEPPTLITVNSNVGETEQIPWGTFELPFLPGTTFETGVDENPEYGTLFRLTVTGPKKYRYRIEGIFELVQKELETNSLYRGKAFDGQPQPEFVDVYAVDRAKVLYSEEVTTQLEANVWGQLRHTEGYTEMGIPLKRAVLIHGPFGTGKTLAMMITGQEAISNGWTFIKLRPGRDDLTEGLKTARLYQPCVVAYEDIDVVAGAVEAGDRSSISRLLDDFDGIEAKGTKILCILTTNYPEKIHKGMARPGRLDAMIELNELDQAAVEGLVRVRIPADKLEAEVDWKSVFEAAEGYKPAFVTEFADRAMRYVLVRSAGELDGTLIGTDDLVSAARGLRPQYEKMEGAKDITEREPLAAALDGRVKSVIESTIRSDLLVPAAS
jgi:transitional endoplasmic reticulum ATPase